MRGATGLNLDMLESPDEIHRLRERMVPRSGNAQAYRPEWLPLIRRIPDAGKLFHGVATIDEAWRPLDELPHRGLFVRIRDQATSENLGRLEKDFDLKPW